jgi:hypothetical protein
MTKKQLAERIKRELGFPMIKVELDDSQIYDSIDLARQKFIKWAVGQSTTEHFFTLMLSAGQNFYDLPVGVTEVVNYNFTTGTGDGINTLFTIENYLFNQGMYEMLYETAGSGYTLISYHIARDFLDTIRKYTPDKYSYNYRRYTNELEIHPAPPSGNSLALTDGTWDSPGFILVRAFMIEGSTYNTMGLEDYWSPGDTDEDFYGLDWILEYSTALCKIKLGMIRRKFENFASIGNAGVSLDGSDLIGEGKEEKEALEERLKDEETFEGWGIEIGF